MASQWITNLTRSRPPCASLNLHNHGLQVHLQTCTITASNCIFKLVRSRPRSVFPNSLDHGLQVHSYTCSITASKCVSKLALTQPPRVSLTLHDIVLQVRPITASGCILKLARFQPPRVSPTLLDYGLGVHCYVHWITVWWNCGARRQSANHHYSAAPGIVSEGNLWEWAVSTHGA
jgi:hypothetical protein